MKNNKKNLLFIGPNFHSYSQDILEVLCGLGYNVTFFKDFSDNFIYFFLKQYFPHLYKIYLKNKKQAITNKINLQKFDVVFVIKGEGFDYSFYNEIKKGNLNAKFILYQWDSISNFNYLDIIKLFHNVYTFDRADAERLQELNVKYLPLFYKDDLAKAQANLTLKFDLCFIGGVTIERYNWLRNLQKTCKAKGISTYIYMYLPFMVWLNLVFKLKWLNPLHIKFLSVSLAKIKSIYYRSGAVIDIHSPRQHGLTMRTIEVLGMKRKLITTNNYIRFEEFFNESNVLLITPQAGLDINILQSFLETGQQQSDMSRYSLINWVKHMLNEAY